MQTHSVTVDGHVYRITEMGSISGTRMLIRLGKLVGDSVVAIICRDDFTFDSLKALDMSIIGAAANMLLSNLEEDEALETIVTLFKQVKIQGGEGPVNFDHHFAGRYKHMLAVLIQVLKVNYRDFFDSDRSQIGPNEQLAQARAAVKAEIEKAAQ